MLQKPIARDAVLQVLHQLGLDRVPPPTVLVADDDPAAVEVIALNLQSAGFKVSRAYGGRTAIDLVLADFMAEVQRALAPAPIAAAAET